ncbi:MAG: hypothetical protein ABIV26_03815 [Candidatus Limnocylindrales bacterium]
MLSLRTAALGAALALVVGACGGGGTAAKTVTLATLNGSGVSGTATLTDAGSGQTLVVIKVEAGGNADMPAHVHPGTCTTLDPKPKYPLNDVKDGASTTTIAVALADLTKSAFAVNLHKSAEDVATYTACGDIK